MKFNKEVKVGLLGIVSIVVLYFGFNFLKGMDLFSTENEYTVVFKEVSGLQNSNAVTYKGVTVGRVMAMDTDQDNEQVKVTLAVNKKIALTDSTRALLADDGLIGGKMIKLNIGNGSPIKEGSELIGAIELGLADAAIEKITPALADVEHLVTNLDAMIVNLNETVIPTINALMKSTNKTTDGVNAILSKNAASLEKVTENAALLTNNLNNLTMDMDAQMKPILTKASTFADSLNAIELNATVLQLNKTVAGLQDIISSVNNGDGTLGKLTNDDSLYVNLDRTAASMDRLLSDMEKNPRRYVHFSLFGGKDKSEKKAKKTE